MKVLCFGNEFWRSDSLAKQIGDEMGFEMCDNPADILKYADDEVVIIDVVKDLKEVKELSIDLLKTSPSVSAHDFDLCFYLKLMEGVGRVKDIRIIGIPMFGDKEEIKKKIKKIIQLHK